MSRSPACALAPGRKRRGRWPCLLLAVAGCTTLDDGAARHLSVFDTYWQALADRYPYFGQKHVDWAELRTQYRSAAVYARRPSEFYHLLCGMLARLQDPHVSLTVPIANWREDGVDATSLDDIPGFDRFVLEGRLHVASWPPGEEPRPPDHLRGSTLPPPEIVRIEDVPVVWPLVENLFLGPPGSSAELVLAWIDGTRSRHVLRRPKAPPPPIVVTEGGLQITLRRPGELRRTPDAAASLEISDRLAVLRIDTLSLALLSGTTHGEYARHLDALIDRAMAADGLILDLRNNGGGDYDVTRSLAGRFLRAPFTQVLPVQTSSYLFGLVTYALFPHVDWPIRPPVFAKPVAVLTSWHTGSAAEHLARLLQAECGAIVVGERTIGAEAAVQEVTAPDGSTLAFGGVRLLDTRGRGLQDEGVVPDVPVRLRLQDVERLGSFASARADWEERIMQAAREALTR